MLNNNNTQPLKGNNNNKYFSLRLHTAPDYHRRHLEHHKLNREVRISSRPQYNGNTVGTQYPILQYSKCQAWRHAADNCSRPTKCYKCAGLYEITAQIVQQKLPGLHREDKPVLWENPSSQANSPNQAVHTSTASIQDHLEVWTNPLQ